MRLPVRDADISVYLFFSCGPAVHGWRWSSISLFLHDLHDTQSTQGVQMRFALGNSV